MSILTAQVEAENVSPHSEVIDDHGRERRGWIEKAAVHNQDIDVCWPQACREPGHL